MRVCVWPDGQNYRWSWLGSRRVQSCTDQWSHFSTAAESHAGGKRVVELSRPQLDPGKVSITGFDSFQSTYSTRAPYSTLWNFQHDHENYNYHGLHKSLFSACFKPQNRYNFLKIHIQQKYMALQHICDLNTVEPQDIFLYVVLCV